MKAIWCLLAALTASPGPRYGGAAAVLLEPPGKPSEHPSIAAVFETPFRSVGASFAPNLVDLPEPMPDGRVLLRVFPRIRHDGGELGAEDLRRWVEGLARPGHPHAHLALPIAGARARIEDGSAPLALEVLDRQRLAVGLAEPALPLVALWSRPEAAVALEGGVGTGPFRIEGPRLRPFLGHRDGRPYLDAVKLAPAGARAAQAEHPPCAEAFLVAAVGELAGPGAAAIASVLDRALDRVRLAAIDPAWTPADRFFPEALGPREAASSARKPEAPTLTWTVSRAVPRGVAERLQLELMRAGLATRIERRDEAAVGSMRRHRQFALLLDEIVLPIPAGSADLDLLLAASRFGGVHLIPPELWVGEGPRLERWLRERLHLVVLAKRPIRPGPAADLAGARVGPMCAVELADAEASP